MIEEKIKERLGDKIVNWDKKNERRYYIEIKKEDLEECAQILFKDLGIRFCIASGIDTIKDFEVLYHFSYDKEDKFFSLKVKLGRDNPEVPSISKVIKGAEWIEREMWELLGINFSGHPELKKLLLDEDWPKKVYPLRKDYKTKKLIK